MKITHAYCIELHEEVTIDQARRAYLNTTPRPERYHFVCTDERCRSEGVVITGVNYTSNAEESIKHRAAHFAVRNPEKHHANCEWRVADQDEVGAPVPGETLEQSRQRILRRKLTDLITDFDPRDDDDRPPTEQQGGHDPRNRRLEVDDSQADDADRRPANPRTRTSSLERLVQTYREAREVLSADEMNAYRLRIAGLGTVRLVDYFRRIPRADEQTADSIIYGGAVLEKQYGIGFKLRFFDRVNKVPVYLYVSSQQMRTFHHQRYLDGVVSQLASRRYVTVYANGVLGKALDGKSYNLVVGHLRHLALVLGPRLEDNPIDS